MAAISAASILAKVTRDAEMTELDARHPEYGFARHKGYPTAEHLAILARAGPARVPAELQTGAPRPGDRITHADLSERLPLWRFLLA